MADDCLFCRIIAGDEPSEVIAQDDHVVAFRDKFPRAPVHVLVCTREHIDSLHQLTADRADLLSACVSMAQQVAESEDIEDGYRLATNVGHRGGQAIPHLHFHVLGGRQLAHIDSGEPPA